MTPRVPILNTDTDTAETFRLALGGLWVQSSALNPRTGVTSTPVLAGTGNLTATVGPFTAMIDGTSGALQGGYPVALDTAGTVTIGAGNTQARIDLISLQIKDNDYDASGLHQGQLVVTAGTPSGSPVAPAAPANSISLWTVPVAANATSVTWASATAVFPYTAAAGGIVPVRNATDQPAAPGAVQYRHRLDVTAAAGSTSPLESTVDNGVTWKPVFDASAVPASTTTAITTAKGLLPTYTSTTRPASPNVGLVIYETDTANVMVWNGAAWVSVLTIVPAFTSLTGAGIWSGSTFSITKVGGQCYFRGTLTASSAPTSSVTACSTLPAAFQPASSRFISATSLIPGWPAVMLLISGGVISVYATGTATAGGTAYLDGASYWLS